MVARDFPRYAIISSLCLVLSHTRSTDRHTPRTVVYVSTCCVCIEDFSLGEKVTRLPCGHLLHRPCAEMWLGRHCTCPVCRYELRTDEPWFERERHVRMAEQVRHCCLLVGCLLIYTRL